MNRRSFLGKAAASLAASGLASTIPAAVLSMKNNKMTEQTARVMVKLIRLLEHPDSSEEFIKGSQSVFHVLIRPVASWEKTYENVP